MFKKVNSILLTFITLGNLEKRFVYTNVTRVYTAYIGVSFPRTISVPGEWGIPGNQIFPRGIPGDANLPNDFKTKTKK